MRGQTSATSRTHTTVGRSSSSHSVSPFRSSMARSRTCGVMNTESPRRPRLRRTPFGNWPRGWASTRTAFGQTVDEYNNAVQPGEFHPATLDGKRTEGIDPPKSNWALPIDDPPYHGFAVTCGITFTFGGLRINRDAQVLDTEGYPIPGAVRRWRACWGSLLPRLPGRIGPVCGHGVW